MAVNVKFIREALIMLFLDYHLNLNVRTLLHFVISHLVQEVRSIKVPRRNPHFKNTQALVKHEHYRLE